jgi:amidohydrolase
MLPLEKLRTLRHDLHAHPELSGQEAQTAARVETYLLELKPDGLITQVGGHGIVATFESGLPGPSLLFRCELDALPINEVNTFQHRSSTPEVAHKCGHDGHMSMLCGLAELLVQNRPARGKVHLLFQPAEEIGAGARAVLEDPKFASIQPDMAFALHNLPGHPLGSVIVRNGLITAAVIALKLTWQGWTAHASQPEFGRNPALAIAEALQHSQSLNHPDPSDPEFRLVTPVHMRVGSPAYGVAAGDGELHLTLRSWTDVGLEELVSSIVTFCEELAKRDGLELRSETKQHFAANNNDAAIADVMRQAALESGLELIELPEPLKGGEDFGLFTARFPCCMALIGSGENSPSLHNPDYDFPDELLEPGVHLMDRIVRQVLG